MSRPNRQFLLRRQVEQVLQLACLVAGLVASAVAPALALRVEQIESAGGIKAWLVEERGVPLIAIRFAFAGGAVQDPLGKEGLTSLTADLLMEGAGNLSSAAFKERLSSLGTRLSTWVGRDLVYGELQTLTGRLHPSVELLRLMLTEPNFSADVVDRIKAQRLTDLAVAATKPDQIALERWYQAAFSGHAYGRPIEGAPGSVGRLTREDFRAHHARLFAKDGLKVVIVGDIDRRAASELLDTVFGGLPAKAQLAHIEKINPQAREKMIVVKRDYPLATAVFGLPSLSIDDPDYSALKILNHIVGSGDFDARLVEEIRVKRGLAYSVQTTLEHDSAASILLGSLATKNETMKAALDVLKKVLATMAHEGPTPAQFENAKRYLAGSFLLDFDTNSKVAGSLLGIWLDGEGPEALVTRGQRIEKVTLQEVKRVAAQVLKTDQMIVTVVGNPKEL